MNQNQDRPSRSRWLTPGVIVLSIGLLVTSAWIVAGDFSELSHSATNPDWRYLAILPLLTLVNVGLRFLRWTFLLRRIDAYVPTRENLRLFLSSFALILAPLFASEAYRAYWLRRRTQTPMRVTAAVVVSERLYDVLALLVIGLVCRTHSPLVGVSAILGVFILGVLVSPRLISTRLLSTEDGDGSTHRPSQPSLPPSPLPGLFRLTLQQFRPLAFVVSLGLSTVAWLAASLVLTFAVRSVDGSWRLLETLSTFAIATPLGGLSLLPGGIGVTGSLMLSEIQSLGLSLADSTVAVILTRASTYWFAAGAGLVMLLMGLRRRLDTDQTEHFENVAEEYEEEIPAHVRDHLLEKKNRVLRQRLGPAPKQGLDLGCGQGWYALDFEQDGHQMVGVDRSHGQLIRAQALSPPFTKTAVADAKSLPFREGSLDFIYCINVLHHIIDEGGQESALNEIVRALKPGGQLFIHEINVTNPIFRFYMGYVFPLINEIDLGNERWLYPMNMPQVEGATLEHVDYFTFLPDFIPRPLFRLLLPFERRLENSRFEKYSAHYMATYRKSPPANGPIDDDASAPRSQK